MCQQTLNMNGNFVKLQAGNNITSDAGSARMHLLCLAHLTAAAAASNQQLQLLYMMSGRWAVLLNGTDEAYQVAVGSHCL